MIVTIIVFVLIFGVVVIAHELGPIPIENCNTLMPFNFAIRK